ncbi:hypothetical protein BC828DRAFT_372092 [Blastocladiella britannica]|nr:hypothetical protein BC828DRAFT_372092 [Blastocladiella britannica]
MSHRKTVATTTSSTSGGSKGAAVTASDDHEPVSFNRNRMSRAEWARLPTVMRAKFLVCEPPTPAVAERKEATLKRIRARTADAHMHGRRGNAGRTGPWSPTTSASPSRSPSSASAPLPKFQIQIVRAESAAPSSSLRGSGIGSRRPSGFDGSDQPQPQQQQQQQPLRMSHRASGARSAPVGGRSSSGRESSSTSPVLAFETNISAEHLRNSRFALSNWKHTMVQQLVEGQPSAITAIILSDIFSRPVSSYLSKCDMTVPMPLADVHHMNRLVCRANELMES